MSVWEWVNLELATIQASKSMISFISDWYNHFVNSSGWFGEAERVTARIY